MSATQQGGKVTSVKLEPAFAGTIRCKNPWGSGRVKVSRGGAAEMVSADVLTLKGSSYRLKDTGIDTLPSARADNTAQ